MPSRSAPVRTETLNRLEIAELFEQDPSTRADGGFQSCLVKLQGQCDRSSGKIELDAADLERIPRYAFDYENGGWQNRLMAIFGRVLGKTLGR